MTIGATAAGGEARRLLSSREVADRHGVTVEAVARWCKVGVEVAGRRVTLRQLGAYRVGRVWRIPSASLAEWERLTDGGEAAGVRAEAAARSRADAEARDYLDERLGPRRCGKGGAGG